MLRLLLVRHAKSSWKDPALDDHERPLNERGLRDAPRMAEALVARVPRVGLILSSPARRARDTAATFARRYGIHGAAFRVEQQLYTAGPEEFGVLLRDQPLVETLMLVGHSTGMDTFFRLLAPQLDGEFPTCTVACLNLPISRWSEFRFQPAPRAWKLMPRELELPAR